MSTSVSGFAVVFRAIMTRPTTMLNRSRVSLFRLFGAVTPLLGKTNCGFVLRSRNQRSFANCSGQAKNWTRHIFGQDVASSILTNICVTNISLEETAAPIQVYNDACDFV